MHAEAEWQLLVTSFLLVLARVSGVIVFVPLPGTRSGPEPVRIVLALAIAVSLTPLVAQAPTSTPGPLLMTGWLCEESAFGLLLGLTVNLLTESLVLAAQIFGLQAGYSYASPIDPNSQADSSVLQVVAQLASSLLFLSLGLDREVLRVLSRSFVVFPSAHFALTPSMADYLAQMGIAMWSTALRLSMPVVALLLLVDIALALVGRIQAQLQLLTLAFPIKMLAALGVLAITVSSWPLVFRGLAAKMLLVWRQILR